MDSPGFGGEVSGQPAGIDPAAPLKSLVAFSGTSEADQLFFDQIAEAASQNESLRKAAEVNSREKFQLVFEQVLESLFIERMELNEELFNAYMSKPELQELVSRWLGSQVYDRLGGSQEITGRGCNPR